MKNKILLTTVGGVTSPDIINCIRSKKNYLLGVDKNKNAVGKFFVDRFILVPDSNKNQKKFVLKLKNLIQKYKINALVPCGNDDNLAIKKYKKLIEIPVLNSLEFSKQNYFDKLTFLKKLKESFKSICPNFYILNEQSSKFFFKFNRFIIKPSLNTGGRGVYEVRKKFNKSDLIKRNDISILNFKTFNEEKKFFIKKNYFIMEKLNGPIVSVYSICKNGKNFFSICHIREWGNASQTFRGKVFYSKKYEKIASKIIKILNLSYAVNMEFGIDKNGNPKIFDLNPRIGASFAVHQKLGLNLPQLALDILFNKKIKIDKFKKINSKFYRYFSNVWNKK